MTRTTSWRHFVHDAAHLGDEALTPGFDEDAHVDRLTELARHLDLSDPVLVDRFDQLVARQTHDYATDTVVRTPTCRIMLVSLRAGGSIGLHDHPLMGGFILCVQGSVQLAAFDIVSEVPLHLQRVLRTTLGPGYTAALTSTQANLHHLGCATSARLIDVFTPIAAADQRPPMRGYTLTDSIAPDLFAARRAD